MRILSRTTVALACAAALALPAQAAQRPASPDPVSPMAQVAQMAQGLGALWGDVTHLGTFAPAKSKGHVKPQRTTTPHDTGQGGACIDPDGCV